jgi:anti-sigma-K factor RskA
MTHEDIKADLPLFALGTLDANERRHIDAHLTEGCEACARELVRWREVVGLLPLALDEAVSPDLKEALLGRVRDGAPRAAIVPLARRQRWIAVPLAAAAAALMALGIARDLRWRADAERQRDTITALRAELQATAGDLARVRTLLADREADAGELRAALAAAETSLGVLRRPGLHLVRLQQTPDAAPAEAHLLVSAGTGEALFYAFDLPAVSADQAYELWWITEKEGPVNAGVFRPDPNGLGRVRGAVPPPGAGAVQAAAVTIEPAGGVAKPTGPMVLFGKWERT